MDRVRDNAESRPGRIVIFGRPGSGKSTFAFELSKFLKLPLYHLDRYFFVENWAERNHDEFLKIQKDIVAKDKWIIDGNSLRSLEIRYARADLVLCFIYPCWLCYFRVFKRLFKRNTKILDRAEGCKERISWSLLKYIWTYQKRMTKSLPMLRNKYPDVNYVEITSDTELNYFMDSEY